MRTITVSAMAFMLLSATATTLQANGPMGNASSTSGASKPTTKVQPTAPSYPCRTTAGGRMNCTAHAATTVNPNHNFPQYIPGYVSGAEGVKGMQPRPPKLLPPGVTLNTSGWTCPHLGTVPGSGGPDHCFVIYPNGSVSQRFDTDPSRYISTFPNMDAFRNQVPGWKQTPPYTRTVFQIYCPPNCGQRH